MSGTTESDKGTLPTRQPTEKEDKMIQDILCNYQLKPTEQTYSHYTADAVFHDPVSIARGKESIQSQFNGMPRLFAKSITEHWAVLEASTPNELKLNLTQRYIFKSPIPFKSEGAEKTINSKLTFRLNEEGAIKEHIEEWFHEGNATSDDGFMGKIQEFRKKADAKLVEATVSSDPKKVDS